MYTSEGWGPRACSSGIRIGFRARRAPFSGVPSKGAALGRRRVRKRKISPKVVELALTASHSKASWDGARFGLQAGKELRPEPAKLSRVPQTHMCPSPLLPPHTHHL